MKRCGRLNSAIGFRRYPRWNSTSSRFHEQWRLKLPFFCTLSTFAVAFAAAPAFAGINSGSTPQISSDSMVYAFSTGDSPNDAAEIPQAAPSTAAGTADSVAAPQPSPGQNANSADYDDGIIRYEHAKDSEMSGPPIGSLNDFMSEGDITSPLGFVVREDKRRLKSGREAEGLLIVDVFAGSPAARAGLHPYRQTMRNALETAAIAGAMFCPPVVLLVPVFDQVHLGESYDLIIGIDGSRVTNFLDFEDHLRDVQAGEIVYFSIVRNGERMQVPVSVPDNLSDPTF
jgi:PDZ domain